MWLQQSIGPHGDFAKHLFKKAIKTLLPLPQYKAVMIRPIKMAVFLLSVYLCFISTCFTNTLLIP